MSASKDTHFYQIKQMLETTKMNILKRITNKKNRPYQKPEHHQHCNIQPIGEWVIRRKEVWNDHISGMDVDRIIRIARDSKPNGSSSPHK